MKMEFEYIEKLVELFSNKELTELTVEDGEKALVIKKQQEVVQQAAPVATAPQLSQPAPQVTVEQKNEQVEEKAEEAANRVKITSPMVGTFYRSPSPGSASFTELGKTVNTGQVVCIIEAMKLMNEIESEVSGKVVEICVEDGQPVEFGETLMVLEQ